MSTIPPRGRSRRLVTRRTVAWTTLGGIALLGVLVGIAWRTTNVLWFLLFPLLLAGILSAAAMAVLWGLRRF